jgi:hypothetical protein
VLNPRPAVSLKINRTERMRGCRCLPSVRI